MAKIALVNPSSHTMDGQNRGLTRVLYPPPPMGLALLGAILEEHKHEVRIYDMVLQHWCPEHLLQELRSFSPDAIGVSILGPAIWNAQEIFRKSHDLFPSCFMFAGNALPSEYPQWVFEQIPELDAILVGEAETSIAPLLENPKNTGIAGVLLRNQAPETFVPAAAIASLDDLPFPAWHLLPNQHYLGSPQFLLSSRPILTNLQSRGCPWKCSFCAQNFAWSQVQFRSIESIVSEMHRNLVDYEVDVFGFYDSIFPLKPEFGEELYHGMERMNLLGKVQFLAETRVDLVWPEAFEWLQKAGLHLMLLGIEHPSIEILQSQSKTRKMYDVPQAVETLHQLGVHTYGLFMLGLPGETPQQREALKQLALSLPLDVASFGIHTVYAGSPEARQQKQPMDLIQSNWRDGESSMASEVVKAQKDCMRAFYLRPSMIWKYLTSGNIRWDRLLLGAWELLKPRSY